MRIVQYNVTAINDVISLRRHLFQYASVVCSPTTTWSLVAVVYGQSFSVADRLVSTTCCPYCISSAKCVDEPGHKIIIIMCSHVKLHADRAPSVLHWLQGFCVLQATFYLCRNHVIVCRWPRYIVTELCSHALFAYAILSVHFACRM